MGARFHLWWQYIRKHWVATIIIVVVGVIVLIVLGYLFKWDWTGFNSGTSQIIITSTSKVNYTATISQPSKTLWDWLQLLGVLAIPVVVGFGVAWFTAQQGKVSDRENTDNQRETALQAYIDKMSELLLEKHLRESAPGTEVRTIARVRTSTVVRRLDPKRKGAVLRFVQESNLIESNDPIIKLELANFSEADLRFFSLKGISAVHANLWKALLYDATLQGDFRGTTFDEADLRYARLGGDFQETRFVDANLSHASLGGDFSEAIFIRTNLEGVDLSGAYLNHADLSHANLRRAVFGQTQLCCANLSYANLEETDFRSVNLERAILKGATNVTPEQLNDAYLLRGATMPDGSIHP
jgi:uncharacterized protein YjbI with pentapeptide repeats